MSTRTTVKLTVGLFALVVSSAIVVAQAQLPLFDVSEYTVSGVDWLSDVDVADINADGILDIGVMSQAGGYWVLFGRDDGTFFAPLTSPLLAQQVWKATLADVDGDARADRILVGIHDKLYVQKSLGNGLFSTLGSYPIACAPFEARVADLNGDLHPDLVASFGDLLVCGDGIKTWLGNGSGGFSTGFSLNPLVSVDMGALSPADLDGDGDLDLAGSSSGGTLCEFLGAGDGSFSQWTTFSTASPSADTADVDEDGWIDVLGVATGNLLVFRGLGQGVFGPVISSPGAPDKFDTVSGDPHIALGDFNSDGHVDAAGSLNGKLMISLGLGTGAFEPARWLLQDLVVDWVRPADVDGNGSTDLVLTGGDASDHVFVLLNLHPAWPWTTVAPGLPAAGVAAPKLSASGSLVAGQAVTLSLANGASGATAVLVVGLDRINAPFKGGVLVPLPILLLPVLLDAQGGVALSGTVPAPLPAGLPLYLQTWIVDTSGPAGFTSSNALMGKTP